MKNLPVIIPSGDIENKIFLIRGKRVMIDSDLSMLYGVEVKQLKRAVRRNIDIFPEDFMFQLSSSEYQSLRRQFGTLKKGEHAKYLPYVFTEQGVAMLSSVLHSKRAIQVNIQIMRVFASIKRILLTNAGLRKKIEDMEKKYDQQFQVVFAAIKKLLEPPPKPSEPPPKPRRPIGFSAE